MINKLAVKFLDPHTSEVLKKSGGALIVKLIGALASFMVSVSLGRLLGADGLGIINLTLQIGTLVMTICLLGLPPFLLREVAIAKNNNDTNRINSLMKTAFIMSGVFTTISVVILIASTPYLIQYAFNDKRIAIPLIIALIIVITQVFSRIFSAGLIGFKKIWQGNLVDQTLSITIVGLLILLSYLLHYEITVNTVALFYGTARIIILLLVGFYWNYLNKIQIRGVHTVFKETIRSAFPLVLVSAALILSTSLDSIMLGWLSNSREVGIYTVAIQLAMATIFFQQVSSSSISPKIAILYSQDKRQELERMVKKMTALLGIIGLLSLLLFLIFGGWILQIWGDEFKNGYWTLIVLAFCQFINIASGPVVMMLIMTKNEKIVKNITIITLLLNILLNYFLIIEYKAIGAAISTLITTSINMTLCSYYVKRKIGFTPINILKWR